MKSAAESSVSRTIFRIASDRRSRRERWTGKLIETSEADKGRASAKTRSAASTQEERRPNSARPSRRSLPATVPTSPALRFEPEARAISPRRRRRRSGFQSPGANDLGNVRSWSARIDPVVSQLDQINEDHLGGAASDPVQNVLRGARVQLNLTASRGSPLEHRVLDFLGVDSGDPDRVQDVGQNTHLVVMPHDQLIARGGALSHVHAV